MLRRVTCLAFVAAVLLAPLAGAAGAPTPALSAKAAEPAPVQLFLVDPGTDKEAGQRVFEALLSTPQKSLAAGPTCTFVSNFCQACSGGKLRSCDRYRCGSPNPVTVNECTPCANYC